MIDALKRLVIMHQPLVFLAAIGLAVFLSTLVLDHLGFRPKPPPPPQPATVTLSSADRKFITDAIASAYAQGRAEGCPKTP